MTFQIKIKYDGRFIRLTVEQLLLDQRVERYKVHASNGSIVIESNRPLLRTKGLKHKPPQWKPIETNNLSSFVLEKIYLAIQDHVDK
jgi:hypothetical protein